MITIGDLVRRTNGTALNIPSTLTTLSGVVANGAHKTEGSVYVAVKGTKHDGHDFLDEAFRNGAVVAVVEDESALNGRPGVVVADSRRALSGLSALFFGDPSKDLSVVGITGTNGKTTTHWLLYHLLNQLNSPCLRIGTLGARAEGVLDYPGVLTTPGALQLQELFAEAKKGGVKSAVMEVSSHALAQGRVDDVAFDVGAFTNLTRDHLDFHGTMEEYFEAKALLFQKICTGSKTTRGAVLNIDDAFGRKLGERGQGRGLNVFSFGQAPDATVRIKDLSQTLRSSTVTIGYDGRDYKLRSALIGLHNAQNLCTALCSALALGYKIDRVIDSLQHAPQVPGRLESVGNAPFGVYVDYAHTPDGLQNVLSALKGLVQNKLWVVFGCGGDRDRGKRPQMADIAARFADRVVVTSDNPRTEDPHAIIRDILSEGCKPTIVEVDRRSAIRQALLAAKPGDVVLIAGKGHEDYQIIGTEKIHFSDVEEAAGVLVESGYAAS